MDEVGRGPLAGPVLAAAVILPVRWGHTGWPAELAGLNDFKQLTEAQREKYFAFLIQCPEIEYALGRVEEARIDAINILQATHEAMNAALARLTPAPEHALVDGRPVKSLRVPQTALIKGDARSYSIAAASVVAKVTRDRLMREYHQQWPEYGFADQKATARPSIWRPWRSGPVPIPPAQFCAVEREGCGLHLEPRIKSAEHGPDEIEIA